MKEPKAFHFKLKTIDSVANAIEELVVVLRQAVDEKVSEVEVGVEEKFIVWVDVVRDESYFYLSNHENGAEIAFVCETRGDDGFTKRVDIVKLVEEIKDSGWELSSAIGFKNQLAEAIKIIDEQISQGLIV
jgi:hypothetical protein